MKTPKQYIRAHPPYPPSATEVASGLGNSRAHSNIEDAQATPEAPAAVTLTLQAEGDGPPFPMRLKTFLKHALRRHGLRCTRMAAADVDSAERGKGVGHD